MSSKKLYILRHAQAPLLEGVEDKDRPLSAEGLLHAQALSERMQTLDYRPDFILCSPAERTRRTCAAISDGGAPIPVIYDERLYLAGTGQLYECLKDIDDKYDRVLLLGHNPGIHGLVRFLSDGEGVQTGYDYPPGCLSVMICACSNWNRLMPAANRMDDLLT